jgi:hypothetical protein
MNLPGNGVKALDHLLAALFVQPIQMRCVVQIAVGKGKFSSWRNAPFHFAIFVSSRFNFLVVHFELNSTKLAFVAKVVLEYVIKFAKNIEKI